MPATAIRSDVWEACRESMRLAVEPAPGLFGHCLAVDQVAALVDATEAEVCGLVMHLAECCPHQFRAALEVCCDVTPLPAGDPAAKAEQWSKARQYAEAHRKGGLLAEAGFTLTVQGGAAMAEALERATSRECLANRIGVSLASVTRRGRAILQRFPDAPELDQLRRIVDSWDQPR
jgi:hypothetical protein